MIATGFDSEFFQQQAEALGQPASLTPTAPVVSMEEPNVPVDDVDMNLDPSRDDAAAQFASESTTDIWNQPMDDDDDDTPAFLRRRKKHKSSDE